MTSTTSTAYQVAGLIDKMGNADKDYRFMAINDLMRELQSSNMKLDDDSERKVVEKLLKLLEDNNGEVQNLAVKCLSTLTHTIREQQATHIVDHLCHIIERGNEVQRDIGGVALKTVIGALSSASLPVTNAVVLRLTPKLNHLLGDKRDVVQVEILDIIGDILLKFGSAVYQLHKETMEVVLKCMSSERPTHRKRATLALGHLAACCSPQLYDQIVEHLAVKLREATGSTTRRSFVVALTCVAKANGARFASHLDKAFASIMELMVKTEDEELKEALLQSIDTFFHRCPKEMTQYESSVQPLIVESLSYDPNYCYDDDDDNGDTMEVEDDDEGDTLDDDYSDDDDLSWKVRRAAAKAAEAMMVSRRNRLTPTFDELGPILISRLKEREENVRSDIFAALTSVLKQARLVVPNVFASILNPSSMDGSVVIGGQTFSRLALSVEQEELLNVLAKHNDALLRNVSKQMRNKSVKTRSCCFELLSQLVKVLPNALHAHMGAVVAGVGVALTEKGSSAQMKCETLAFLSRALNTHSAQTFLPYLQNISDVTIPAVNDTFYKVAGEALTVAYLLVAVLSKCNADQFARPLFLAVQQKLGCTDIDQEVKERAIGAAGHYVSVFGGVLNDQVPAVLTILVDRLHNEMTRMSAVRAINEIAQSQHVEALNPILGTFVPLLADFLKKNVRALKLASLQVLEMLLQSEKLSTALDAAGLDGVFVEVGNLVKESDLQISQLALRCLIGGIERYPRHIDPSLLTTIESIIVLLQSALLQGATLQAALDAIRAIVVGELARRPSFEELLDQLTAPVYDGVPLSKTAFHSISAATAVVASASGNVDQACSLVNRLSQQLANQHSTEAIKLFALASLGELGRRYPQVYEKSPIQPEKEVMRAFSMAAEDLKTAGAQALGALAVGNISRFLPFILNEIETQPKRQYLLLHALKEVISWESVEGGESIEVFREKIEVIWPVLQAHAGGPEEGTRNIVAECIGKLAIIEPTKLLPMLKEQVRSPSAAVRSCVVTSLKYMISDEHRAIDELLHASIGDFLCTIQDQDLNVRRVALVALNSAAHNKPALIRDKLPELLPAIYGETVLRKELIREVEMGPFKHQVDDGLDLRKTAFECMYTLLDSCLDKIDVITFIQYMEEGLKDTHHDIRLLTFLMLIKLSGLAPSQVLQRMDRITENLKSQLLAKAKANAVKQDQDKLEELKRAAIRVVFALQRMPDADRQPHLTELRSLLNSNSDLAILNHQIRDKLPELLPAIYGETVLRKELIREVEMGPFKHQVDDGLDLRKTAFECMYTLLDSCLDKIDVITFIQYMEEGLKDTHHDIRLLTFLMLIKLSGLAPSQVLQRMDRITENLKSQLLAKAKANAVKQDQDKLEELKRAAIRVVFALQRMPDADRQPHLTELRSLLNSNSDLAILNHQVQKDAQRTLMGEMAMEI